ncbi:MAG: GxxExxY protein [Pyrinomonadaceae bacterium]|nr:GxxExxY protein [Pyrinomonadaceae bacterium]
MPSEQYLHYELAQQIIGTFYEVYNELGHGFIESVYEKSLCIALRERGFEVYQQIAVPVWFRGNKVGDFTADVLVNKLVLLELKVASSVEQAHIAQLLDYLKATPIEVGMLFNFGPKPEFKRTVFNNSRKNIETNWSVSDPILSASSALSAVK